MNDPEYPQPGPQQQLLAHPQLAEQVFAFMDRPTVFGLQLVSRRVLGIVLLFLAEDLFEGWKTWFDDEGSSTCTDVHRKAWAAELKLFTNNKKAKKHSARYTEALDVFKQRVISKLAESHVLLSSVRLDRSAVSRLQYSLLRTAPVDDTEAVRQCVSRDGKCNSSPAEFAVHNQLPTTHPIPLWRQFRSATRRDSWWCWYSHFTEWVLFGSTKSAIPRVRRRLTE